MPRIHFADFCRRPVRSPTIGSRPGPGVRVDSWIRPETRVSQYYDNLMAKLVVWGADRPAAIRRARRALKEFQITGVATTIPAHLAVLDHPDFEAGTHYTKWMEDVRRPSGPPALLVSFTAER